MRTTLAAMPAAALAGALLVRAWRVRRRVARRRPARDLSGLEEARARLESLVRSSGDAIYATRFDGQVVDWNAAAERLYGWTAPEIVGKDLRAVVPRDRADELCDTYARARAGELVPPFDTIRVRKDGVAIPVSLTISAIVDASGRPVGISTIARDIGPRLSAEEALRRAHAAEQHFRRELEQIGRASEVVSEAVVAAPAGSLRAVLQTIALQAQAFTEAEFVALGIGTDPAAPFDPWVFVGMDEEHARRLGRPPRPVGTLGIVIRAGTAQRIADLREHPEFRGFPPGHPSMTSFLGVPIRYGGQPIGHMYLTNKRGGAEFTDQDERTVELLAARAGITIVTASLYESEALERAWLQAVIDQMPEGVVLFDAGGRVTAENRAMQALSGDAGGETDPFGNRVTYDLRRPKGERVAPHDLPHVRALSRGESILNEEAELRTAAGKRVPICVSAVPVRRPGGEIAGATAIFQDITFIKEMERMREEWASVIAHDLRQPVGVIKLAAALLPQAHGGPMSEHEARSIERIAASADRLETMIHDLLDVSCLDAKRLVLQRRPVDPAALVEEIVQRSAILTRGHAVTVRREGEIPSVSVDPGRIEQVVTNLLSNAAKYGAPGTPIGIRLERRPAEILVTVTNAGRGIPPDEIGRLFERFARSSSSRRSNIPGIGLGLYICRGLVEAHGGRIWAESTPGETTRLCFTLPIGAPAEPLDAVDRKGSSVELP